MEKTLSMLIAHNEVHTGGKAKLLKLADKE